MTHRPRLKYAIRNEYGIVEFISAGPAFARLGISLLPVSPGPLPARASQADHQSWPVRHSQASRPALVNLRPLSHIPPRWRPSQQSAAVSPSPPVAPSASVACPVLLVSTVLL